MYGGERRRMESKRNKYEYNGDRRNNRIGSIYRRFPDVVSFRSSVVRDPRR